MKPLLIASLLASGIIVSGCKLPGNDQDVAPPAAPPAAPVPPAANAQPTPADNPMIPQGMAAMPTSAAAVPGHPGMSAAETIPAPQVSGPPVAAPVNMPMQQPVAPMPMPQPTHAQVATVRPMVAAGGHDQFELCEADSWQKAIQVCKEGQLVSIIPSRVAGGDQFQLATSAGICDFTQQIISRTGGVVCVFTRKRYDFVMAEQAKADDEHKQKEAREKDEKAAKKAAQLAAEAAAAANAQVRQKQPKIIDPITGEPVQPAPKSRNRPVVSEPQPPQSSPFGPRE